MQFIPFYLSSLYVWSIGLILFLLGGYFCTFVTSVYQNHIYNTSFNGYRNTKWFIYLVLFAATITIYKFKSLNGLEIGSKELGEELGIGGIIGRSSNILLISIPFFMTYKMNKLWKVLIIALLAFFLICMGSKTWLTYAIIVCFVIRNTGFSKKKIWLIIGLIILLVSAFFLYYKLNTNIDDNTQFLSFASRHMYFYITSGLLPYSEIVANELSVNPPGITLPFITIFSYWLGEAIASVHSSIWVVTDQIVGKPSNVFTFFGTLWILGKNGDFVFLSILSGFICYLWYYMSKYKDCIFLKIGWGFTVAILFFGWYNWGFALLRIWEIYIYCFLAYYVSAHIRVQSMK